MLNRKDLFLERPGLTTYLVHATYSVHVAYSVGLYFLWTTEASELMIFAKESSKKILFFPLKVFSVHKFWEVIV